MECPNEACSRAGGSCVLLDVALNDDCCEEQANYDDMTVVVIYLDHPDPSCEWGYYGECCGGEPCSFAQDGETCETKDFA